MIGFPTDGVLQTAKWDTTPCMLDSAGGLILNEKKRAVELTPRRELASKYQKEIFDRDSTMPHHSSTGNIQQPCLENPAGEGIARGPADYIAAAEGVEHWSRGTETSTILKLPFYARRMRDHAYGLPAGTLVRLSFYSLLFISIRMPRRNFLFCSQLRIGTCSSHADLERGFLPSHFVLRCRRTKLVALFLFLEVHTAFEIHWSRGPISCPLQHIAPETSVVDAQLLRLNNLYLVCIWVMRFVVIPLSLFKARLQ